MNALCITLNPALDTTYVVASLEVGQSHRVIRKHETPGGKGNNVARILASRGHSVVATGFLGGPIGNSIALGLSAAGVDERFYRLDSGNARVCLAILDLTTSNVTEVLEVGPTVSPADVDGFEKLLGDIIQLRKFDVITISGSSPPGVGSDDLGRIGAAIRQSGSYFVVDSSGSTLRTLYESPPDLISPNRLELNELLGQEVSDPGGMLLPHRTDILLSEGRSGASLLSRTGTCNASVPEFRPVNTVGCGDALLAGFLDARFSSESDSHPLKRAVAFGSAAALQEIAGVVAEHDIIQFEFQAHLSSSCATVGGI